MCACVCACMCVHVCVWMHAVVCVHVCVSVFQMLKTTDTYMCDFSDVVDFLSQHTHVAVNVRSLSQCQNLFFGILQKCQGKAEQYLKLEGKTAEAVTDNDQIEMNKENVLTKKIKWDMTIHINGTEKNTEKWREKKIKKRKMYSTQKLNGI